MRGKGLIALAACGLAGVLWAQAALRISQLEQFLRSSLELKHPDRQVAQYLSRIKLAERLTDPKIEEFQGWGAGPRTLDALRVLRDSSSGLAEPGAPPPAVPRPTLPPPSPMEQQRILREVRGYARDYTKSLPDFICTQVTRRYYDPTDSEHWRSHDVLTTRLSYFEEKESYKLVLMNGLPTDMPYEAVGGASSTGEFGSMLKEIFDPASETRFEWLRWATLRGRRAHVFSYSVRQDKSRWRITYERSQEIIPGYAGLIFVDAESGRVVRLSLDAGGIPAEFPIRAASTVLDYDFAAIGERQYLLPLRAVVRLRERQGFLTKNEVEFRAYRKFAADATITFDTPDPLPEEQTRETPQ